MKFSTETAWVDHSMITRLGWVETLARRNISGLETISLVQR